MALREPSGGIPADRKWITKVKEEGPPQMGQHLMGGGGAIQENGRGWGVLLTGKT